MLQMSSLALQAHLDPAGKVLDAFFPRDRPYGCSDCFLQVRDSLGVVALHRVLKVPPQIKIWEVQVQRMWRPLRATPAADQSVRETLSKPCQWFVWGVGGGTILLEPLEGPDEPSPTTRFDQLFQKLLNFRWWLFFVSPCIIILF